MQRLRAVCQCIRSSSNGNGAAGALACPVRHPTTLISPAQVEWMLGPDAPRPSAPRRSGSSCIPPEAAPRLLRMLQRISEDSQRCCFSLSSGSNLPSHWSTGMLLVRQVHFHRHVQTGLSHCEPTYFALKMFRICAVEIFVP